jgi:hypothetical protein
VATGDLNGDGASDLVFQTGSAGNGLGAAFVTRMLLLSSAQGLVPVSVETAEPSLRDFLKLGGSGSCLMLQLLPLHVSAALTSDGRPHWFWVYDLLDFDGASVVRASDRLPGFPRWILYAYEPTATPTTVLSDEAKGRAWAEREYGRIYTPTPEDP